MNEDKLITYYNKFNEDKRLNTRHGQVEFVTTIHYINKYLKKDMKIIEIGAGSGKYSKYFADMGYDVTAVELVKHNLRMIEKNNKIKAVLGNATNLNMFEDNTFDLTLLFGPMYHLLTLEEAIKALSEAKRITKKNGIIMVAYVMNDYAIIRHGFKEHYIKEAIKNKEIDNFKIIKTKDELYKMVTIDDINKLNEIVSLKRLTIFTPDGPANYIRNVVNELDDEEFKLFQDYVLSISERQDLIGASAHTVDVLKKV